MDDDDIERFTSRRPRPFAFTPWRPDVRAMLRVLHPLPVPTVCNCCGGAVALVDNGTIYGRPFGYPWAYQCKVCGAHVGLHPNTDIPLATLADGPTRAARSHAHACFDPLWKGKDLSARTRAYAWLAREMRLPLERCHISMMDAEQCKKVATLCMQRQFSARS